MAGYVLILRGSTFNVGDRIVMGGVRGDVIALGFMQTTIMEMGQPPPVQSADPAMWVKARQYTGRVVTVSNLEVFDEPVFNYTREFPYLWEEITVRSIAQDHAIRDLKDAMTRDILAGLDAAGIGIASATYDIVGLPPIRIERTAPAHRQPAPAADNGG